MDDILDFWFDSPAADSAALFAKMQRWFQSGATLDPIVRQRFGALIVDALVGRLDGWAETPHGRLALIVILDQLTRHAFRGTARMYLGDETARRLALAGLARGDDRRLDLEERMFFIMPLVHSERLADLDRALVYAMELADEAPPALREAFEASVGHVLKYQCIIKSFGRFPHRNELLGRRSTDEEEAFLAQLPAGAVR